MNPKLLIVSAVPDEPFASDIAAACGQTLDYADLISLKTFLNGEFCPRFISDPNDYDNIGTRLHGQTIVIVSACSSNIARNELTWRNMLVARAAKENGAAWVVLLEPDLFFAAQDRGPRVLPQLGELDRDTQDLKRFDGQPHSALLHAEVLKMAGVDSVLTAQSHSPATDRLFERVFQGHYANLIPTDVYARYILESDVTTSGAGGPGLILCAPDQGVRRFVQDTARLIGPRCGGILLFDKSRMGERKVSIEVSTDSTCDLNDLRGREVLIFDDMIRTGVTIRESCRELKAAGVRRIVFFVTHFQSSREARENLNGPEIDEIITTDCIPSILNRDQQGRLRRKLTVLKVAPWIASRMLQGLHGHDDLASKLPLFRVDMSSKNPRFEREAARAFGQSSDD